MPPQDDLEQYEATEAHGLLRLFTALPPPPAVQAPPDFRTKVLRQVDQLARGVRGIMEVVSRISAPWFLPLAGVPVGAADIPSQEHVFQLDEGFIQVTCRWWAASQGQPATVWLEWKTDTILPGDLWVRFTQRDDTSAILAERLLGNAFRGECSWFASVRRGDPQDPGRPDDLGFDPLHEPWALILLVKASQG